MTLALGLPNQSLKSRLVRAWYRATYGWLGMGVVKEMALSSNLTARPTTDLVAVVAWQKTTVFGLGEA